MTEPWNRWTRKKTKVALLLAVAAAAVGISMGMGMRQGFHAIAEANASTIAWCEEKDGSCKDVCRKHKTTVVVFHATWCPACKAMDEQTLSDPAVRSRLASYGAVRVDIDANPGLSQAAHIQSIPTTVVLDGTCREMGRVRGAIDPASFLGFLDGLEKANE